MQIGILYSRIRKDEKLLLGELRDRGHEVTKIDVRKERFGLESTTADVADLDWSSTAVCRRAGRCTRPSSSTATAFP